MSDPQQLLFVYGTLRTAIRDPEYQMLDRQAEYVGMGSFQGKLYNLGSYPGATPLTTPEDRVKGEVYGLKDPDHTLPILDDYEGSEYHRQQLCILLDTDEQIQAWIYIYNQPVKEESRILSGDFLNQE
jgi:pyruvate carboxylase